jgi:hypothetical protein
MVMSLSSPTTQRLQVEQPGLRQDAIADCSRRTDVSLASASVAVRVPVAPLVVRTRRVRYFSKITKPVANLASRFCISGTRFVTATPKNPEH